MPRTYSFNEFMQTGIYWITPCIAQGAYPEEPALRELRRQKVTHIVNVGTAPLPRIASELGFTELFWKGVTDLVRIPDSEALECLTVMHRFLAQPDSAFYIHCVAGQNRSPTILWLYLIACGTTPARAKEMIESNTLDAIAGHPKLIDDALVQTVQRYGKQHFQPLQRTEIIVPITFPR
jgi:hypothetical protein